MKNSFFEVYHVYIGQKSKESKFLWHYIKWKSTTFSKYYENSKKKILAVQRIGLKVYLFSFCWPYMAPLDGAGKLIQILCHSVLVLTKFRLGKIKIWKYWFRIRCISTKPKQMLHSGKFWCFWRWLVERIHIKCTKTPSW